MFPLHDLTPEQAIEYIAEDELVEVTPKYHSDAEKGVGIEPAAKSKEVG